MTLAVAVAEVLDELGLRHLPGKHNQLSHGKKGAGQAAKKAIKKALTGPAVLAAPPLDLAKMGDDPRAEALWFRTGDNSGDLGGELGFVIMGDYMRHGRTGWTFDAEFLDERIAEIDSAMRDSVLPEPIEVYRGIVGTQFLGEPGTLAGATFVDRAHVSTTIDRAHARAIGGTEMRIRVPAGVSAIRMADRDPDLAESEILLDRGLTYRVISEEIERDDDGFITKHIINAEVIA